jgi:LysR family transcriptional regulator, cyn operon transcriptional activator
MIINTEWYRVFMYAAQFSNLTKAAQVLHMTQPSVSYTIKHLEEALNVVLFDRLSKGVRLTHEGHALLKFVIPAFAQLDSGEKQLQLLKQFKDGQVRIGANGAIIKDIVLPALDEFHAVFPQIRIRLIQEKTNNILEHIKQGILDIGFIHLPLIDDGIDVMQIQSLQNCFVVGKTYQELTTSFLTTDQLLQVPLLMLSAGSSTRSFVEQWFNIQGYSVEADIELNSLDMLTEFTERGYGAAFVPRSFVQSKIKDGVLFELQTQVPIPDRQLGIATKHGSSLSLSSASFLEAFKLNQQEDDSNH